MNNALFYLVALSIAPVTIYASVRFGWIYIVAGYALAFIMLAFVMFEKTCEEAKP